MLWKPVVGNIILVEGMVPYSSLLLAFLEGWFPSANWRALWALQMPPTHFGPLAKWW